MVFLYKHLEKFSAGLVRFLSKFLGQFSSSSNWIHQKSRESKIQLLQDLEIFLSVFVHDNFITLCHSFTKMKDDSKGTFNMKVVDINDI